MLSIEEGHIWIIAVGFFVALLLTLGIGANDVANTFGTSVGAKVLTLRQACILASVFEVLGAILLGAKVSDTVRKGIIDVEQYHNDTELFMVGNVAALGGSGTWLVVATILKLPVSGTHSIIGAIMGFTLVAKGANGVSWTTLGLIVASWFVSPVLSGLVSTGIFLICKYLILNKKDALEPGLRFLPVFYACTVVVNVFSIFYDGPELLGFDRIPLWGTFVLAFGTGSVIGIVVRIIVVPWQRKRIIATVGRQLEMENQAKTEAMDAKIAYVNGVSGEKHMTQNGDLGCLPNGWTNANLNAAYESDEEKTNVRDRRGSEPLHIRRPRKISLSRSISVPQEDTVGDDGLPTHVSRTTPGIIKRIRRLSRSKSNTEDSLTLTENEDIEAYLGQIDDADDDDDYENPSSPPDSPTAVSPKESPLKTVVESPNSEGQAEDGQPNSENQDNGDPEAGTKEEEAEVVKDRPETAGLFSFLQILTAIFGAFAHGGNDVSNAIGPVVSIWLVATTGEIAGEAATPIWILFIGGVGISVGLWIWGRRVIETMGEDLSTVTPSSGFCIEIGAALTVLIASNLGVPISSTHCKVGSIVFVGRTRAKSNVDWKLFRNIVLAWVITLPASGLVSAALMALLQLAV